MEFQNPSLPPVLPSPTGRKQCARKDKEAAGKEDEAEGDKGKLEKEVESSSIPRRHLSSLEKERELDPLGKKGRTL